MAAQGAPQQQPRALVLSSSDRDVVIRRLARAVLKFQDEFLERDSSPAGLLCQCWLPKVTEEKEVVLVTKGMPFCVAGLGDLLALFRCISCRFSFGTNVKKTAQLGAPGRVFTSSEPELACNVQQYSKTAYLRKAEAEQCQVQSTLLLPLFLSHERRGCVGVLEVVQTSEDMHFTEMADLIASVLEKCQLYTAQRTSIERQLPRATATATLLLPPSVDILGMQDRAQSDDSNGRAHSTEDAVPMADEDVLQLAMRPGSVGGTSGSGGAIGGAGGPLSGEGGGAGGSGPQVTTAAAGGEGEQRRQARAGGRRAAAAAVEALSEEDDEDLGEDSGDDMDEDGGLGGGGKGDAKSMGTTGTGRRRGKGTGNPGKPGVRLRLEDLQSQFGVGLKEAAARLGICPTTLKRACRRHGIQRWPRRQLMKVNQALDQMEAQGGPLALLQHQHQHQAAAAAQQHQQAAAAAALQQQAAQLGALSGLPAPDTRWTTLAQFIPAFQSSMQYNDHLLPYNNGNQPMLGGTGSMAALSGIGGGGGGVGGAGGSLGGLGLGGWGNGGGMNGSVAAAGGGGGQLGGLGLGLGGGGGGGFPGTLLAELQAGSAHGGGGGGKSAFQPPGNRGGGGGGPAASPSKAESGTSSLPAGVLPLGGGGGAGGGNGNGVPHPIFGFPAEAPALSGISSLGQPPPPADLGSGSSAQRLAALKAGLARAGNNAAGAGMGVGAPSLQGKPSWQLPSLQLPLSAGTPLSSLDYELGRLAAPGGPGMGGGPGGQQGVDPEQQLRVNDDDVGFLDSSVLEMLLQEDASRAAGNAPSGLTADDAARGAAVSSALSSLKFR